MLLRLWSEDDGDGLSLILGEIGILIKNLTVITEDIARMHVKVYGLMLITRGRQQAQGHHQWYYKHLFHRYNNVNVDYKGTLTPTATPVRKRSSPLMMTSSFT